MKAPPVVHPVVLMADDDEDDLLIAAKAFRALGRTEQLRLVSDGKELMEYLLHQGAYSDPERFTRPDIILLDLNMPRKDGREALREIKANSELRDIQVVILTTSREERDVQYCEKLGAASFITKPNDFEGWVKIIESLTVYSPGKDK